jgi:hypothetical protein
MNRLILILLLIGMGIYVYSVIFNPEVYNQSILKRITDEIINDDFVERFPSNWHEQKNMNNDKLTEMKRNRVHFSENVDVKHIENNQQMREKMQESELNTEEKDIFIQATKGHTNISIDLSETPINTETSDIFIKPVQMNNTSLTMSENEYFN